MELDGGTAERAPADGSPPASSRWTGRAANSVAALVFLLIGVGAFWFIHRFAVNLIYFDQWKDIALVRAAHTGSLTFGTLWAQHNENRILFPNLVVLALAYTTHLDVIVEDYLSGALWCLAVLLIVLAHRRRSPSTPWILYCPVALVLLSFLPLGDALFGFNLTWFMALAGLASALFLLDRPALTWPWMGLAVGAAVVGSYSSLQGLLIWPAGLVLLWLRRRPRPLWLAWAASGAVATTVYFVGFDLASSSGSAGSALRHPVSAVRFFFSALGNVFGQPVGSGPSSGPSSALGLAVFVVAVFAFVRVCRSDRSGGGPIGAALITFGFLFVLSTAVGRLDLGVANTTRYSVFTLTFWVGTYLALLSPSRPAEPSRRTGWRRQSEAAHAHLSRRPVLLMLSWVVLVALLVVQVPRAFLHGYQSGEGWHAAELDSVAVAANIDTAPDMVVVRRLGNYQPSYVRGLVPFARSQHLSLFDTALAARDRRAGIDPTLLVAVLRPLAGSTVSGTVVLDARAEFRGVRAIVSFRLTGPGGEQVSLGTAKQTYAGWLSYWDTRSRADGVYALEAQLAVPGRPLATSAPLVVVVRNGP